MNILILERRSLIRHGLRSMLKNETFVKNVYEADNVMSCRDQLNNNLINIVLFDTYFPKINLIELVREIMVHKNLPKVIAMTELEGEEMLISLVKIGVNSIVFKVDGSEEFLKIIFQLNKQKVYYTDRLLQIIQTHQAHWENIPSVTLSYQEREIIEFISQGNTTKEMAILLKMSESTTETYRTRLIKKLRVSNTASLVSFAYRNGII